MAKSATNEVVAIDVDILLDIIYPIQSNIRFSLKPNEPFPLLHYLGDRVCPLKAAAPPDSRRPGHGDPILLGGI